MNPVKRSVRFPHTSRAQLPVVARAVLSACRGGRHIVALSGPLGSGKSTLVRAIGKLLGVRRMPSPTYVLIRSTRLRQKRFQRLVHADLYRLHDRTDAAALGLNEDCQDPSALVLVEWAERARTFRPDVVVRCSIPLGYAGRRTFTLTRRR